VNIFINLKFCLKFSHCIPMCISQSVQILVQKETIVLKVSRHTAYQNGMCADCVVCRYYKDNVLCRQPTSWGARLDSWTVDRSS